MGRPAARITDMHTCPLVTGTVPHVGGPILPPGAVTVWIGGLPAARVGDKATCVGPPDVIIQGSATVLIGGLLAARMGDRTAHAGKIKMGFPTVLIGGKTVDLFFLILLNNQIVIVFKSLFFAKNSNYNHFSRKTILLTY